MLSNPDVDVLGGCALVVDFSGEIIGGMRLFFNKFGVEVSSNKLGVFIQLEVKNCISLSSNQILIRKRAEKE